MQSSNVKTVSKKFTFSECPIVLAQRLNSVEVRFILLRTGCYLDVQSRVLNRLHRATPWTKGSIVEVVGPSYAVIDRCNELIDLVLPSFQDRRPFIELSKKTNVTKTTDLKRFASKLSDDSAQSVKRLQEDDADQVQSHDVLQFECDGTGKRNVCRAQSSSKRCHVNSTNTVVKTRSASVNPSVKRRLSNAVSETVRFEPSGDFVTTNNNENSASGATITGRSMCPLRVPRMTSTKRIDRDWASVNRKQAQRMTRSGSSTPGDRSQNVTGLLTKPRMAVQRKIHNPNGDGGCVVSTTPKCKPRDDRGSTAGFHEKLTRDDRMRTLNSGRNMYCQPKSQRPQNTPLFRQRATTIIQSPATGVALNGSLKNTSKEAIVDPTVVQVDTTAPKVFYACAAGESTSDESVSTLPTTLLVDEQFKIAPGQSKSNRKSDLPECSYGTWSGACKLVKRCSTGGIIKLHDPIYDQCEAVSGYQTSPISTPPEDVHIPNYSESRRPLQTVEFENRTPRSPVMQANQTMKLLSNIAKSVLPEVNCDKRKTSVLTRYDTFTCAVTTLQPVNSEHASEATVSERLTGGLVFEDYTETKLEIEYPSIGEGNIPDVNETGAVPKLNVVRSTYSSASSDFGGRPTGLTSSLPDIPPVADSQQNNRKIHIISKVTRLSKSARNLNEVNRTPRIPRKQQTNKTNISKIPVLRVADGDRRLHIQSNQTPNERGSRNQTKTRGQQKARYGLQSKNQTTDVQLEGIVLKTPTEIKRTSKVVGKSVTERSVHRRSIRTAGNPTNLEVHESDHCATVDGDKDKGKALAGKVSKKRTAYSVTPSSRVKTVSGTKLAAQHNGKPDKALSSNIRPSPKSQLNSPVVYEKNLNTTSDRTKSVRSLERLPIRTELMRQGEKTSPRCRSLSERSKPLTHRTESDMASLRPSNLPKPNNLSSTLVKMRGSKELTKSSTDVSSNDKSCAKPPMNIAATSEQDISSPSRVAQKFIPSGLTSVKDEEQVSSVSPESLIASAVSSAQSSDEVTTPISLVSDDETGCGDQVLPIVGGFTKPPSGPSPQRPRITTKLAERTNNMNRGRKKFAVDPKDKITHPSNRKLGCRKTSKLMRIIHWCSRWFPQSNHTR